MKQIKSNRILVSITLATIILFSCHTETYYPETRRDTPSNPIVGTWNFISMDAKTQSVENFNAAGFNQKSMAELNFVTENNGGKMIISDSVIASIGLTYTISSNITTYNYRNGILIDSSEKPYNTSFYEPQSSCTYKMIGSDSISFPKGGFTNISSSTLGTAPSAAKISFKDDTLTFKQYIYNDTTEIKLGTVYHTIQTGTATMTFQKK
jgi:hypothetical protein